MVDPDNEERLLKVPPRVVQAIKEEAYAEAVEAVKALNPTWVSKDDAEWEELDRLEVIAVITALGEER